MENGDVPWKEDDYTFDRRRITTQKRERTDDPDYEQPQVHLQTARQAEPELQGAAVLVAGTQAASSKPDVCCLVKGCHADLSNSKAYYRRFRICEAHMKSLSLSIEGRSCRFCQQCGKFHLVEEFDGANRNCRKALMIRFYKRRNMPLTNLQPARSGQSEPQAASATAAVANPAPQELKLEPRKRGRPRAPRPDILEEDPPATSGGSGPGSPTPAGGVGTSAAASRAAAAAGFDTALQAAYIAASRGYQGASGLGVTPATAIGPPGYSQGGVRMAGIEIDEMDEDCDRPPLNTRRRGTTAVNVLLSVPPSASGGSGQGRRGPGAADRAGGTTAGGDRGALMLDGMQSHQSQHVQAQLEAPQGVLGHGSRAQAGRVGTPLGHPPDGSGSLSRCSSSQSQDPGSAPPSRGGGGRDHDRRAMSSQLGGAAAAAAATAAGVGSDGTREAADTLTALGGALGPILDAGMMSGSAAQLGLASLLGSLGAGGLLQVLPPQPGGEGPRLQLLRGPPAGQHPEESGVWRGATADAETAQPGSARPMHAGSDDGAAAEVVWRKLKLGGLGGLPSPHRHRPPDYQDALQEDEQQPLLRGGLPQQRGGGTGHGRAAAVGAPPSMATINREGVEVLPVSGSGVAAATAAAAAVAAAVQGHEADRVVRLSLRDACTSGGGGDGGSVDVFTDVRRLIVEPRWGQTGPALELPVGLGGFGAAAGDGASGPAYDRDRGRERNRERDRELLGLDMGPMRGGGGGGTMQSSLLLGQHGSLAAASDVRRGSGGGSGSVLSLDVGTLFNPARCRTVGGGSGAFAVARGCGQAIATGGGGGVQYLRLDHGDVAAMDLPPRTELRSLSAAVPPPAGVSAPTDEDKRNAAVARLLSQMPVSQQLDILQQMPHDQMTALLQMLPHAQQVALLLELQDERRVRVLQEQQLLLLQGRTGGGGGGSATLALDLALDTHSTAPQSVAAAATQRIAVAPVSLSRKPIQHPMRPPLQPLGFQHRHEAVEAMGPLELVSLANASRRLQRMPEGSTQVVWELPVTTAASVTAAGGPSASTSSAVQVLRLQPSSGLGANGPGATVQLTAGDGGGSGGASIALPGNGALLLNLGNGAIRLPSSALVVRGGAGGGGGGAQCGTATAAVSAPLLAVEYGSRDGSEDALERLSLKLHGVRPEQLAPDVAQRMQTWLQSMDAVTLQGTLRSGCVNLVLDISRRRPASRRRRQAFCHNGNNVVRAKDLTAASAMPPPPAAGAAAAASEASRDGGVARDGDGAASPSRHVPDRIVEEDRLAAAVVAAALGLDVRLDDGLGDESASAAAAVSAAAAAMGVQVMVQVGSKVVYPPGNVRRPVDAVPVVYDLAPLSLVRGEPAVLHMLVHSLDDSPVARLHVRLNGRRLAAFVQPEAELVLDGQLEEQQQQRRPVPTPSPSSSSPPGATRAPSLSLPDESGVGADVYSTNRGVSDASNTGRPGSCDRDGTPAVIPLSAAGAFSQRKPKQRQQAATATSLSAAAAVADNDGVGDDDDDNAISIPSPQKAMAASAAGPIVGTWHQITPQANWDKAQAPDATCSDADQEGPDSESGCYLGCRTWHRGCCSHTVGGAAAARVGALVYLDPPTEPGLAVLEWEAGSSGGVLGSWWPLVVAPSAEVAAEVNGLAGEAQQQWWQRRRPLGPQRVWVAAAVAGVAVVPGVVTGEEEEEEAKVWEPSEGLMAPEGEEQETPEEEVEEEEDGDEEEGDGDEESDAREGKEGLGPASRLHQLLTDLGLVLDALHSSSSTNSIRSSSNESSNRSSSSSHSSRCCNMSSGNSNACSSHCAWRQCRASEQVDADASGDTGVDAGVGAGVLWEEDMRRLLQRLCRLSPDSCPPSLTPIIVPNGDRGDAAAACVDLVPSPRASSDAATFPINPELKLASEDPVLTPPGGQLSRGTRLPVAEQVGAATSPLSVAENPSMSASMAAASPEAAAAAALAMDPQVLDCYVRRAKRLLPFCLSRAMPHTAAEMLQFLTRVACVPYSELLAELRVQEQQQPQQRQRRRRRGAAASPSQARYRKGQAVQAAGGNTSCSSGGAARKDEEMEKGGFSLLHVATSSGCVRCVELLLREGIRNDVLLDPFAAGPGGRTPLQLAAVHGATEGAGAIVISLLSYVAAAWRAVAVTAATAAASTTSPQLIVDLYCSPDGVMPDIRRLRQLSAAGALPGGSAARELVTPLSNAIVRGHDAAVATAPLTFATSSTPGSPGAGCCGSELAWEEQGAGGAAGDSGSDDFAGGEPTAGSLGSGTSGCWDYLSCGTPGEAAPCSLWAADSQSHCSNDLSSLRPGSALTDSDDGRDSESASSDGGTSGGDSFCCCGCSCCSSSSSVGKNA